eukprot:g60745.t1
MTVSGKQAFYFSKLNKYWLAIRQKLQKSSNLRDSKRRVGCVEVELMVYLAQMIFCGLSVLCESDSVRPAATILCGKP